ncbi:DNA polymerase III subunit delta [Gemmatimonas aurantiaca]|nr:DNA polymerase III subunit delta [Gemmatimonas aurantiaca]
MKLSAAEFAKELKNDRFSPAYYFMGDDDYRMNEAIRFVAQSFLPKDLLSSNVSRIDLASVKFDDLQVELMQQPFFGERKVLVIVDPQKLSSKQLETTLKYISPGQLNQQGQLDQIVILYTRAARKPKSKSAFFKRVSVLLPVIEFGILPRGDVQRRAAHKLGEFAITIDMQASAELFEMTGGDSGKLNAELEKLISFVGAGVGGGGNVTVETIQHVCAQGARRSVYQLVDAVVAGDIATSMSILEKLLTFGESPTGILFWLGNQYTNLYLVKGGRSLPYYQKWLEPRLKSQAYNLTFERIEFSISLIADCEAFMKGGVSSLKSSNPRDALSEVVLKLATPVVARASRSAVGM